MLNHKTLSLVSLLLVFSFTEVQAQANRVQQGVIFKKGTNTRISNAEIINTNKKVKVVSNDFGIFRIIASPNDTLVISGAGYISQSLVVNDYKDFIIHLQAAAELQEVQVNRQSIRQELDGARREFRSKGIYYNGKPPLYLLLPIPGIGQPLTFINELFGKKGRQARRFNKFADGEIEYYDVSSRFNNSAIKNAIPQIKNEELEAFKTEFWPSAEQVRKWNDYDLISYIKKSYIAFKAKNSNSS